ncbi:S8 family serine peptidase [Corynebacterium singulare]|uniref:S8 family serine peptidase n=1 Tax=Corynebacterium singulare TaxID=161899 RepID=A0ABS9PUI9_9CORY|nr:S8 family serine peptidase [Corynebacterium singulare]MCG7276332.1 S8 family serine peptidase [Corynebacterium singulare]
MKSRKRTEAVLLIVALAWGTLPPAPPEAAAREPDTACAEPTLAAAGPQPSAQYAEYRSRLRSFATGAGVKVAVIDTGVAAHPQLRVTPGADFVTPEEPDPLRDCDVHGTVVAGVIAGHELGVAPDAEIYSIRQTSSHYRALPGEGSDGHDSSGTLASLAAAIEDAVDAGARVINVSVVSCVPPEAAERVDRSGLNAALRRAEDAGAVVVAASGNATSGGCDKTDVVFPAVADTVVAVGALTSPHELAEYSIEAPLSAEGNVPLALEPGGGWATAKGDTLFQGTSFAAPVVSGTIALLMQRYPSDSPAQLRQRITESAQPGHGVVDPLTAVTYQMSDDFHEQREYTAVPIAQPASTSWPNVRQLLALLAFIMVLTALSARVSRPPRGSTGSLREAGEGSPTEPTPARPTLRL